MAMPIPQKRVHPLLGYVYLEYPQVGSCHKDECLCSQQSRSCDQQELINLQYSGGLSNENATRITQSYVESIQEDLEYLQHKIKAHGDTIVNRWKKKSQTKRSDLLRKAFPEIAESRWFPIQNVLDHTSSDNICGPREPTLLPYLSIEGLKADPLKLLAFLEARTKYLPQEWVMFDRDQILPAWDSGRLQVEYADCAVILYGKHYGMVVPWNKGQCHRWETCAFPMARLILEAQSLLMRFLKSAVTSILDGVEQAVGSAKKWEELVSTGFRGSLGVEASSFCSQQAFQRPICDFNQLLSMAKTKLQESDDELWLLQTDAAFFQHTLKERYATETAVRKSSFARGMQICADLTANSIHWREIVDELENVCSVYSKFEKTIVLGMPLPEEFDFALTYLYLTANPLVQGWREKILVTMSYDAAFQSRFSSLRRENGRIELPDEHETYKKDPIFWCLISLSHVITQPSFRLSFLLEYLEHCLEDNSALGKNSLRIGETTLNMCSHFATAHEILSALGQFRPAQTHVNAVNISTTLAKLPDRLAFKAPEARFGREELPKKDLTELANLLVVFEKTPFPSGRRDTLWLEKANIVRLNSSKFWAKAKDMWTTAVEKDKKYPDEYKRRVLALLSFDSTPEHLDSLEAEKRFIMTPKVPQTDKVVTDSKLSTSDNTIWQTTEVSKPVLALRQKEKIKTRPVSATPALDTNTEPLETTPAMADVKPIPHINVKAETVRVLSRMFPETVEEYGAKPLHWRSFVTAMQDAGFSAVQCGTSHVIFSRQGGRINFPKPHGGEPRIDQIKLQTWGKRMTKRFGWQRETLVDVKKSRS